MSKNLDPDHDRHSVGSDLGPNCLKRLSAEVAILLLNKVICIATFELPAERKSFTL